MADTEARPYRLQSARPVRRFSTLESAIETAKRETAQFESSARIIWPATATERGGVVNVENGQVV